MIERNIVPILTWVFAACVGWLIGAERGALIGFTVALGFSVFVSALSRQSK